MRKVAFGVNFAIIGVENPKGNKVNMCEALTTLLEERKTEGTENEDR